MKIHWYYNIQLKPVVGDMGPGVQGYSPPERLLPSYSIVLAIPVRLELTSPGLKVRYPANWTREPYGTPKENRTLIGGLEDRCSVR